jgi:hypothetical protein
MRVEIIRDDPPRQLGQMGTAYRLRGTKDGSWSVTFGRRVTRQAARIGQGPMLLLKS